MKLIYSSYEEFIDDLSEDERKMIVERRCYQCGNQLIKMNGGLYCNVCNEVRQ